MKLFPTISLAVVLSLAVPLLAQPQGGNPNRAEHPHRNQTGPVRNPHAGDWLRKYKEMPLAEQEQSLKNDPNFQRMKPQQQQKLLERLHQFNNLPPEQRERVVHRMEAFDRLSPQQQQSVRALQQRMKSLPEDRRKQMRIALGSLRHMNPQEREKVLNSEQFKSQFNGDELDILRQGAEIPAAGGANRQSQEPPAPTRPPQ